MEWELESVVLTIVGALIGFSASEIRLWLQKRKRTKYVAQKLGDLIGSYSVEKKNGDKTGDLMTISMGKNEALKTKGKLAVFKAGGKAYHEVLTKGRISFHEDNFVIGTRVYQLTKEGFTNRSGKSEIIIMDDGTIHVLNNYFNMNSEAMVSEQFIWRKLSEDAQI